MFAARMPFRQLMAWSLFLGSMHMMGNATDRSDVHPRFSGFNCSGEVEKGTIPHYGSGALICCYPTNCDGGTIKFCTKDKGTDVCVPCPGNETSDTCNYRQVTSKYSFSEVDHCTKPCTRKNAVPDVSFYPSSCTKKEGDDLTIQPTIYSDSVLQGFLWVFINAASSFAIASSLTEISNPEKYLVGTMRNPNLTVRNIELSDQGIYQLYVRNKIGLSNAKNVTLIVTAKPIVTCTMATETDNVDAGNLYKLTCSIAGNPTPITSGFRFKDMRGKVTNISSDVSSGGVMTHTIYHTSAGDSGYYTCMAQNSEGLAESTMHLTVDIPPVIYSPFVGRVSKYDVGENASVSVWVTSTPIIDNLLCKNEDQRSKLMVRTSAYNITIVGRTFNFSIQNIQPQDGGMYVCTATNRLGTSNISVGIMVNFQSQPPTVHQDKEREDCQLFSELTTSLAVISIAFAVTTLVVVHFNSCICGNTLKNRTRIVLTAILCVITVFDITVVVVANLDYCSTSSIVMYIIVSFLSILSICFEIWCCYSMFSDKSRPVDLPQNREEEEHLGDQLLLVERQPNTRR